MKTRLRLMSSTFDFIYNSRNNQKYRVYTKKRLQLGAFFIPILKILFLITGIKKTLGSADQEG